MSSSDTNHQCVGNTKSQGISSHGINSLAPGRPGCQFKTAIFNLVLLIGIFTSSKENALIWMPWDLTDDKSTVVQVMAWCHQATSHYLSQCWPSSMSPHGVTRPQWVNAAFLSDKLALLQLQLHSWLNTWLQWIGQRQLQDETRNI